MKHIIIEGRVLPERRLVTIADLGTISLSDPRGFDAYAYAMAGMCAFDVEVPVTDLAPHGAEETLGIGYEKLPLCKTPR